MFSFLKYKPAMIVTILLALQGVVLYSSVRPELLPSSLPLSLLPLQMGSWSYAQDLAVDPESRDTLKADDLLYREYHDASSGLAGSLFVAAFRSQRNGKAPHSPKNCLPGSGWTQLSSDTFAIEVGGPQPIRVNRYVVQHDEDRSLVLYWYQSRERVVASEYLAKFWVVADSIRLNRTDTALVRVVIPMTSGGEPAATNVAVSFVKAFFGPLRGVLPS